MAQAIRLGLSADVSGSEPFIVAAADTCMSHPSRDLMNTIYPDVPLRAPVAGHGILLAIDKARAVLGYSPGHS